MAKETKKTSADSSNKKNQDIISAVKNVLKSHQGERHIIVLQDYPDPDALSSAYAHKLICAEYEIEADLFYGGKISHPQNIALVKLLKMDLHSYKENLDLTSYDGAVFLDNHGSTAQELLQILRKNKIPTVLIVDHHEQQENLQPELSDIRDIGATATIYAQYLEKGLLKMDASNDNHIKVATALMHGLITDTNNFLHAGPEDFMAAAFLSRFQDLELLEQIMNQSRSKKTMEIISQALSNRVIVESFSIAGIGYLRQEDRDVIPQAADFLVTEENVHTALVYGIVVGEEEESLVGSMRTTRITIDADEFIKAVFGKDISGHYYGGGKNLAGGFKIHLGFLAGEGSEKFKQLKWQTYDSQIKQKIFNKIGYEQENESLETS